MSKAELHGALFFSKEQPEITGYLVIDGVEYEIAGWHASHVRSNITARKRGAIAVQADIFEKGNDDGRGAD